MWLCHSFGSCFAADNKNLFLTLGQGRHCTNLLTSSGYFSISTVFFSFVFMHHYTSTLHCNCELSCMACSVYWTTDHWTSRALALMYNGPCPVTQYLLTGVTTKYILIFYEYKYFILSINNHDPMKTQPVTTERFNIQFWLALLSTVCSGELFRNELIENKRKENSMRANLLFCASEESNLQLASSILRRGLAENKSGSPQTDWPIC